MRFRRSLGALLRKQAKLGRVDASGKLQPLSRSTKLELMKVGAPHLAFNGLHSSSFSPCSTLACQEVLSTFTFVGMGQMEWVSQGNCRLPNDDDNKNNWWLHTPGLAVWSCWLFPQREGSRTKGWMSTDMVLCDAPHAASCVGCTPWRNEWLFLTGTEAPSSLCVAFRRECFFFFLLSNPHKGGRRASDSPTNVTCHPYNNPLWCA